MPWQGLAPLPTAPALTRDHLLAEEGAGFRLLVCLQGKGAGSPRLPASCLGAPRTVPPQGCGESPCPAGGHCRVGASHGPQQSPQLRCHPGACEGSGLQAAACPGVHCQPGGLRGAGATVPLCSLGIPGTQCYFWDLLDSPYRDQWGRSHRHLSAPIEFLLEARAGCVAGSDAVSHDPALGFQPPPATATSVQP